MSGKLHTLGFQFMRNDFITVYRALSTMNLDFERKDEMKRNGVYVYLPEKESG